MTDADGHVVTKEDRKFASKKGHGAKETVDMNRMDQAVEQEEAVTQKAVDTTQISEAMKRMWERKAEKAKEEKTRTEVLAAVKVEKTEIARVSLELDIPEKDAETLLKEANGDTRVCLRKFIGL